MRLVDIDALDQAMYHKSFEVDDGRNVWNSGLWIRYKIYEEASREAPTVDAIPVEFIEKEINMTKKGGADMYPHCLTVMLNRWKRAERKEE